MSNRVLDDELGIEAVDDDLGIEPVPEAVDPGITKTESALRGAADTASFGFNDEMAGLGGFLAGIFDDRQRAQGRGVDAPVRSASDYQAVRDAERANQKQAEQANPNSFLAGQIAGAVGTAAAPLPGSGLMQGAKALRAGAGARAALSAAAHGGEAAATLAPRVFNAMKTGATVGGLNAAGSSEADNAADVALDTVEGAAGGALLAPVVGETVRGAVKAAPATLKWIAGKLRPGMTAQEAEVLYGKDLAPLALKMADPADAEGAKLRQLAQAGTETDKHAEDITSKISKLWDEGDVIKWHEDIEAKRGPIRKLLAAEDLDPRKLMDAADNQAAYVRQVVREMEQTTEKGTPERTLLNKINTRLNEYDKAAKLMTEPDLDTATQRWMNLDQLKRQIQINMDRGKAIQGSGIAYELEPVERSLREALEDPNVWGQGASAYQQLRNRGWRDRLLLEGKDAPPSRAFLSDASGEGSIDPFRSKLVGDAGKVKRIVDKAGTLEGRRDETVLREWADREAGLLEALTNHVDADPTLLERAARARQLANEISDALDARTAESEAAGKVGKMQRAERGVPESPNVVVPGATGAAVEQARRVFAPKPLSQQAQRAGQLERAVRENPANDLAAGELGSWVKRNAANLRTANALDATGNALTPGKTARAVGTATHTAVPMVTGRVASTDAPETPSEDRVTSALRENPAALGQFAEPLKQAEAAGPEEYGATFHDLAQDPAFLEILRERDEDGEPLPE